MFMNKKSLLLLFFLTNISHVTQPINVIFDMGGVIAETNTLGFLWEVGPLKIILNTLFTRKNPRKVLYRFLDTLIPRNELSVQARDDKGTYVPQIMTEWLKGTLTPQEIYELIADSIDKHPEFFMNQTDQEVIKSIARTMFSPETFVKTRVLLQESIDFVKRCKEQGHAVYILSNWDAVSFPLLLEQNPEFAELFKDHIVLSGQTGLIKPDPAIYQYVLQRFNLDPAECVFIDDQLENVQAARNCGMHAIHCTPVKGIITSSPDIARVQEQFDEIVTQHTIGHWPTAR
jgi:HAD superfamily hydrolase (TIGR01549 family)